MGGKTLRKQVAKMIQPLTSIRVLIIVSWMLKAIHVALSSYLAWKSPFTMTISMCYMI